MVRALERKLWRDLSHMKGQGVAIAVLLASAVAVFVGSVCTYRSLEQGQARYYERYRFADVFASATRAPEGLLDRIAALPGVAEAEARVVADVPLELEGFSEPAAAHLVGMPSDGVSRLNRLHPRAGRLLDPAAPWGVVVNEALATAQRLRPGDRLTVVIRGRKQELHILGTALSPEHVMVLEPGELMPDDRRYGVIWMQRAPLAAALGLEGAFNDVSLRLVSRADEPAVLHALDRLLTPYGGGGAYGRSAQVSHRYLSDDILQLRAVAIAVPAVFLGVAGFLLSIVVGRLVATQREQIATFKALGYSSLRIGRYYAELVLLITMLGTTLGCFGGRWLGEALTAMYAGFYRLPLAPFALSGSVVGMAVGLSALFALGAVAGAVWRAARLPPAEAMRPEPPATFRPSWLERLGIGRLLGPTGRMSLRNLGRRPARTLMSTVGMSFSVALLVVGCFFQDAIAALLDVSFRQAERGDATVLFADAHAPEALQDLRSLDGVLAAEPFRTTAVRLRAGHRSRTVALTGLPADAQLRRVVGVSRGAVPLPAEGLLLTDALARLLELRPGDSCVVEWLEGDRRRRELPVGAIVDEPVGTNAYIALDGLHRLLGETELVTGAYLQIDRTLQSGLFARLRQAPGVGGVTDSAATIATFNDTNAKYLRVFSFVLVAFAGLIAVAVVYNAARILMAERERELATLRVLGLRRGEGLQLVLSELGAQAALAIPLGWGFGLLLSFGAAVGTSSELFRIPVVVAPATYLWAAAVLAAALVLVGFTVRARVHGLDLIAVLKTKE